MLAVSTWMLGWDALQLTVFSGEWIRSGVSWLGDTWLRLPDVGTRKARDLHLVANINILEPLGAIPTWL